MQVFMPLKIDFFSTNVSDETYPIWDSSTSYSSNDYVIMGDYFYKCLIANNGKTPSLYNTLTGLDEVYWSSPTTINSKRCLDFLTQGKTTKVGSVTYEFPYQKGLFGLDLGKRYSSVTFINVKAKNLILEVYHEDGTLLDTLEKSFIQDERYNFHDWYNGEYYFKNSLVVDLPFYIQAQKIKIIINSADDNSEVEIGYILFGEKQFLGDTQVEVERNHKTFNETYIDDLGNVNTSVTNRVLQKLSCDIRLLREDRKTVINRMKRILGKIAFFMPSEEEEFDDLHILGYTNEVDDTTKYCGFGDIRMEIFSYVDVNF